MLKQKVINLVEQVHTAFAATVLVAAINAVVLVGINHQVELLSGVVAFTLRKSHCENHNDSTIVVHFGVLFLCNIVFKHPNGLSERKNDHQDEQRLRYLEH